MQDSKKKMVDQKNKDQMLKHSSLGTAAFILTLIADFFLMIGILFGVLAIIRASCDTIKIENPHK